VSRRTLWFLAGGLAVATVLAFWVSRYASSEPDGLEKVAADRSLDTGARPHPLADGPFADYSTEGVTDQGTSTGVAALVGVGVTFALTGALVWASRRVGRRTPRSPRTTVPT
jgi:cobalt/nickel transport system permease protein